MEDFIYTEKFDKYLKGTLDESDKRLLDKEIMRDPLLNHEVSLQKDIYIGLVDERRQLLKSRLDKVPVNPNAWLNLTGLQWAAIVGSIFLISAGSFYYFDMANDDSSFTKIDIRSLEKYQSGIEIQTLPDLPVPKYVDEAPQDSDMEASIDLNPIFDNKSDQFELTGEDYQEIASISEIVRPEVLSKFAEEDQQINYSDFEAPDKTMFEKAEMSVSDISVENITGLDYHFHYKLVDQKLFLYGDFQGTPYKLIALNREDQKKLFLQYSGSYYSLKQNQIEIVPLVLIEDPRILKALKRLSE